VIGGEGVNEQNAKGRIARINTVVVLVTEVVGEGGLVLMQDWGPVKILLSRENIQNRKAGVSFFFCLTGGFGSQGFIPNGLEYPTCYTFFTQWGAS